MYTEFYGLRGEPFLLTPDHRFYFESTVHSQAMAHLLYGLQRGEGFIVITGEVGAGKTTLVKHLCATIDAQSIIAAHVVTTMIAGSDLLQLVLAAFGMQETWTGKAAMLLRLQSFFEACHQQGRRALLIVDEAQNLSLSAIEELRMLSNFQVGNCAPFQAFLVGQPQFRELLANPALEQLRQRVITSYHLGPMSREEVGEYLPHRLKRVGWTQDPEFEPSAIDALFRHAGGVPRRINTLCSRLLLLGFLDNLHRFTGEDVDRAAADLKAEGSQYRQPEIPQYRQAPPAATADELQGEAVFGEAAVQGFCELAKRVERIEKRMQQQDQSWIGATGNLRDILGILQERVRRLD
jgi:putative secretion ATPase (PEP-CTERM system associated)